MQRLKWTDRIFQFGIPEGWLPNILERLRGTEARLRTLAGSVSGAASRQRPGGKWSIREHIGHLTDLEELHTGRVDDFMARREVLRAADMSNKKTEAADHNGKDTARLLQEFAAARAGLVSRLEGLDDASQRFTALHPRLQAVMKPMDMAFFTAEHDDHHLASIREIVRAVAAAQ